MQGYTQKSQHLGCAVTWLDIASLSVKGRYRLLREGTGENLEREISSLFYCCMSLGY